MSKTRLQPGPAPSDRNAQTDRAAHQGAEAPGDSGDADTRESDSRDTDSRDADSRDADSRDADSREAQTAPPGHEEVVDFLRMARGVSAVGHLADGRVCMAAGAAPGDRARVRVVKEHRSWVQAEVIEWLVESADRRSAPCRHARDGVCGGCGWQHLSETAQRREKMAMLTREVSRVAPTAAVRALRTDIPPLGYRRRARLGHRRGLLGYRSRGTRRIFDLRECPVLVVALERHLPDIREAVRDWPSGNVDIMLDDAGDVLIGGPARSFRQPSAVAERLLQELVLEAMPRDPSHVQELFAGSGTFTRPLLDRGHRVDAWEVDRESISRLEIAAPGAQTHRADLLSEPLELDLGAPDVVVLDPPRKGAKPCLPAILKSAASVVIYVSCDPMTLCRDLAVLCRGGYIIDWVQPVDAFPQTEHLESVTRLVRPPSPDRATPVSVDSGEPA